MSDEATPILAALDAAIASVGFPVREGSVEQAWNLTVESQPSAGFHQRVRRAIGRAVPAGELLLLVTLRARRGRERALTQAAEVFVSASRPLPGLLGSTLYQSATDPLTLTLVERFAGRHVLERHMAAEYFRRFQGIQAPLLAAPAEAVFYEQGG